MTALSFVMILKTTKNMNPINLSLTIVAVSMITAMLTFKLTITSWMPLVLIMVFSSGMMTLFTYVSSLSPNEKVKSKKSWILLGLSFLLVQTPKTSTKQVKPSMKTFSNQMALISITMILIMFMLAISIQTFNPQQSMTTNF